MAAQIHLTHCSSENGFIIKQRCKKSFQAGGTETSKHEAFDESEPKIPEKSAHRSALRKKNLLIKQKFQC